MVLKSVKKNKCKGINRKHLRSKKRQSGGSSASQSTSIVSSAFSSIKKSLGLKRVTDKNCNKEMAKLRQIFSQIKSAYMTLEKEHKTQMNQMNKKQKELTTEMKSARVNSERVSIREEAYMVRVQNINMLRQKMNEIFLLFKNLRCVLIKYMFTKLPEHLAPVFEEYSSIFTAIKDNIKGSTKTPIDLALIKECLNFYLDSRQQKNTDFTNTLRHDILRISNKELKAFNLNNGAKLNSLFVSYCKKDSFEDEIFEGHHIKYNEPIEPKHDETKNLSTVQESVSVSETAAFGKNKRKQRTSKRHSKKMMRA
jgi:hypothetical protein